MTAPQIAATTMILFFRYKPLNELVAEPPIVLKATA